MNQQFTLSWNPPAPQVDAMAYNCAVMVDTSSYQNTLRKMTDVIHATALEANLVKADELDDIATMVILQECLNHYLEMVLSHTHTGNLGFDYYIQEYFTRFAPALLAKRDVVMYLGNHFAILAGQLAHHMQPALELIEFAGQQVEHIETMVVDPGKLQLYVLEASHWDEPSV
jgi:hypothetical protein